MLKNNTSPNVLKVRITSVDKWTNSGEIRKQVFSPTARNDEKQKLEIQIDGTATEGLVHTGAEVTITSPKSWCLDLPLQEENILYKILKIEKGNITQFIIWSHSYSDTQSTQRLKGEKKKKEYYRSISHMSTDVKMVRYLQIQRKDQKYHIWCSTWLHPRDAEMVQHAKMSGKKKVQPK